MVIFWSMLEGWRTDARCLTGWSLCLPWNTDKKVFIFFVSCKTTSEMLTRADFFSFTLCASSHGTCEHELSVQITLTDPACCYFLVAGDSHFSRVKHGASGNSSSDVTACNGEFLQPSPGNMYFTIYLSKYFTNAVTSLSKRLKLILQSFFWKYKAKRVSTEWKPTHIIDHLLFMRLKNRYQCFEMDFFFLVPHVTRSLKTGSSILWPSLFIHLLFGSAAQPAWVMFTVLSDL